MNKYQLKQKEKRHLERIIDEIKKEASDNAIAFCLTVPLFVLHDSFGFGKKRLMEFLKHFNYAWEKVGNKDTSIMSLMKQIEDDTEIVFKEIDGVYEFEDKRKG